MRVLSVVALALCVGLAMAGSGSNEVDSELEVPTLPGMDQGCLPTYSKRNYRSHSWKKQGKRITAFGGKCVAESACPAASSEPGYCAGMGTTCCKGVFAAAPTYLTRSQRRAAAKTARRAGPSGNVPVLRAGTTPCASQGGSCVDQSTCTAPNTLKSGLCPGLPNNIRCCFRAPTPVTPTPGTPTPVTPTPVTPSPNVPMTSLVRIPAGINTGTSVARSSTLISKMGSPGCALSASCFSCTCRNTNALISRNVITLQLTPTVKVTGVSAFVNALKRGLDRLKADGATDPVKLAAYNGLKTAGGLCCRPIKRSNGTPGGSWSNHSWGVAVDFYYGSDIDPRGDGKTQFGLAVIAPYFNAEKLYWAAGYGGSEEDAMHFEASVEALNSWMSSGLLK